MLESRFYGQWRTRCNRFDDLLGSCRQGEGAADYVEHVERPDSISWECDTQQDAPRPRGAPCPSCFHPCLLSRSGKSRSRRTPWNEFFFFFLSLCFKQPIFFHEARGKGGEGGKHTPKGKKFGKKRSHELWGETTRHACSTIRYVKRERFDQKSL